jgi:prefoldin subunit 5
MEKKELNIEKIESTKVVEIIKDYKERSNKDLILALEFIKKDFELTKENLFKMTDHLDKLELTYNTLLKEYESRSVVSK